MTTVYLNFDVTEHGAFRVHAMCEGVPSFSSLIAQTQEWSTQDKVFYELDLSQHPGLRSESDVMSELIQWLRERRPSRIVTWDVAETQAIVAVHNRALTERVPWTQARPAGWSHSAAAIVFAPEYRDRLQHAFELGLKTAECRNYICSVLVP